MFGIKQQLATTFVVAILVCWGQMVKSSADLTQPEQVHLSYGVGPTEMMVTWLTMGPMSFGFMPTVEFGLEPFNYTMVFTGKSTSFNNGNRVSFIHRTLLTGLKPDTVYYYHCGSDNYGWSDMFRFKSRPLNENWSPKIALYGDMGNFNGISIPFLQKQVSKNVYDAIFHVGDLAYNLDSDNGNVGDKFMRQMEPIAAYVPYQTSVGNHESADNFSQYDNRFSMVDENSGRISNHFYSFNVGPAHVISFSSEYYYFTMYGFSQIHNQFMWLEEDLKEATKPENRAKHPWIIAMGHRPMYCSTADFDDCTQNESILRKGIPVVQSYGLEDLFYKYGVDLIFGAHEHTYERLWPVYDRKVYNGSLQEPYTNPKAPVHLLVGSAGCPELVDPFVPYPKPWSAKRITDYGVTEMDIINGTHIRFRQRSTSKNGEQVDAFTLIKEKHGPEAWL